MDVLHVHFEVVVAGELLVAQGALGHGSVGIVGELVTDQHLLQTEREVADLRAITETKRTRVRRRNHRIIRTIGFSTDGDVYFI